MMLLMVMILMMIMKCDDDDDDDDGVMMLLMVMIMKCDNDDVFPERLKSSIIITAARRKCFRSFWRLTCTDMSSACSRTCEGVFKNCNNLMKRLEQMAHVDHDLYSLVSAWILRLLPMMRSSCEDNRTNSGHLSASQASGRLPGFKDISELWWVISQSYPVSIRLMVCDL